MPGAFERVMEQRKELVEKMISLMKQDFFYNNRSEWNRQALLPRNPLSNIRYKGGNRLRLMLAVIEHGYTDPRWATIEQLKKKGYYVKKGEHGIPCEKWIFTREKTVINKNGEKERVEEDLEHPQVSYFTVFNVQQVEGFPKMETVGYMEEEPLKIADRLMRISECPIEELAQSRAFYSPSADKIVLPIRDSFKDAVSFVKTLLHEMGHSTGHSFRLNRDLSGGFGTEKYAREELCAELGALFMETDLGISLEGEHYEDHSDYLKSWISILENDYNELFRICADAEKISERIVGTYRKIYGLEQELDPEIPQAEKRWQVFESNKSINR